MDIDKEERQQVYVSYCRGDDPFIIDALVALNREGKSLHAFGEEGGEKNVFRMVGPRTGERGSINFEVKYDGNSLEFGRSILAFMRTLSRGDRIVFLMSEMYFRSRFCLFEMMSIYAERASDLQPVVVMLDGFQITEEKETEIVRTWESLAREKAVEGKPEAADKYAKFARTLPAALAWLFGEFDRAFDYRDRLFIEAQSGEEKVTGQVVTDILNWLDQPIRRPRYPHLSTVKRKQEISGRFEAVFNKPALAGLKKLFDERIVLPPQKTLHRYLANIQNGKQIRDILKLIAAWMEDDNAQHGNLDHRASICESVKETVGNLMITALRGEQIHRLIHRLNLLGDNASQDLNEGYRELSQVLVSGLFNEPALFLLIGEDSEGENGGARNLKGKLQLYSVERGINNENIKKTMAREERYRHSYIGLLPELRKARTGKKTQYESDKDIVDVDDWIETVNFFAEQQKGFYFCVENSGKECLGQIEMLGKDFPGITPVVITEDDRARIKDYFLPGTNLTLIRELVRDIYESINRIANGKATDHTR